MRSLRLLPLAALAACATADAREGLVTVDTLPGGIPSVTTAEPIERGRWSLVHERDVQPGEGEPGELLDPQDLALGDDGTVAVSERAPNVVHIYGPDGTFRRDIGHEGEGPGEFRAAFLAVRGDTLVVHDPSNRRTAAFDILSGAELVSHPSACCYYAPITVDDSGRTVVRMLAPPEGSDIASVQAILRFRMMDGVGDTLLLAEHPEPQDQPRWTVGDGKRMMMVVPVPMRPTTLHATLPDGRFVSGWSGEYRFSLSRTGRDTTRLFGRPWTAEAIDDATRRRLVEDKVAQLLGSGMGLSEQMLRQSLDPAAIPHTRPAFIGLWTDRSDRIWARLSTPDTSAVHFDVFDHDGRWLDQLTLAEPPWASGQRTIVAFGRDRLAVTTTDADGLPVVRIYRIERSGE